MHWIDIIASEMEVESFKATIDADLSQCYYHLCNFNMKYSYSWMRDKEQQFITLLIHIGL